MKGTNSLSLLNLTTLTRKFVLSSKQPYLHELRHKHAMRHLRGPGGRFLTAEGIAAQKAAVPEADVVHDDDDKRDDGDDLPRDMAIGPVLSS